MDLSETKRAYDSREFMKANDFALPKIESAQQHIAIIPIREFRKAFAYQGKCSRSRYEVKSLGGGDKQKFDYHERTPTTL